jgi:hypothetical protein
MTTYEYKTIRGVPYYINGGEAYTFDNNTTHISIGTYDAATESITYHPDWEQRVSEQLAQWRVSLNPQQRDKLRENIVKPTKQRKTPRAPRKSTRAKNPKSNEG